MTFPKYSQPKSLETFASQNSQSHHGNYDNTHLFSLYFATYRKYTVKS